MQASSESNADCASTLGMLQSGAPAQMPAPIWNSKQARRQENAKLLTQGSSANSASVSFAFINRTESLFHAKKLQANPTQTRSVNRKSGPRYHCTIDGSAHWKLIIPPQQPLPATKAIDAAHRAIRASTSASGGSASGLSPQAFLRETRQEKRPQIVACSAGGSLCHP